MRLLKDSLREMVLPKRKSDHPCFMEDRLTKLPEKQRPVKLPGGGPDQPSRPEEKLFDFLYCLSVFSELQVEIL